MTMIDKVDGQIQFNTEGERRLVTTWKGSEVCVYRQGDVKYVVFDHGADSIPSIWSITITDGRTVARADGALFELDTVNTALVDYLVSCFDNFDTAIKPGADYDVATVSGSSRGKYTVRLECRATGRTEFMTLKGTADAGMFTDPTTGSWFSFTFQYGTPESYLGNEGTWTPFSDQAATDPTAMAIANAMLDRAVTTLDHIGVVFEFVVPKLPDMPTKLIGYQEV